MHKSHSSSSFWDEDEDPIRPGLNHPSLSGQLRDRETDGYASSSSTGTERQLQLRRRGPDSKGEGQHGSTSSLTALEEPPLHRLAVGQSASNGHLNGHGVYGHAHNTEKEPLRQGELSTAEHQNGGGFNVLEVQMPPEGQQERAEFRSTFQNQKRRARRWTSVCLNLAMVFERADEVVLPAVYAYVARTFQATPVQLAQITLARALVQAVTSPIGGLLGHYYNRVWVITGGCLIWGCMTLGFSMAPTIQAATLFWAVNGFGMSLAIPNVQSVTADFYAEEDRGKAFGTLHLTSAAGAALGGLYATNLGAQRPFGWEGWRMAFFILGLISLAIGAANFCFSREPRSFDRRLPSGANKKGLGGWAAAKAALLDVKSVVVVPTFAIIIVQGIIGNIPGQALAFLTLYLQLLGLSPLRASLAVSGMMLAHALGGQLGGWLGDVAAARAPRAGRIIICQFSVAAGTVLTAVILKGLPHKGASAAFPLYMLVFVANGALNAWPAPACNNPIFAEIVPARLRTFVYAFDRSFEMAVAACAAPVVARMAESLFGFQGTATTTGDAGADMAKAEPLCSALLVMTAVPWTLCCLAFSGLYWTYPRDKARVPPAEAYSEELPSGRLEERNGFLRLVEATGAEEEDLGYAKKWQLLRTQPVGRY